LRLKKLSLENKLPALDLQGRLSGLPLKDSDGYVTDYGVEACDFSDDDDDYDDDSIKSVDNASVGFETVEQDAVAVKSSDGWLCIGGVQGRSTDFREAMEEAARKLKCSHFEPSRTNDPRRLFFGDVRFGHVALQRAEPSLLRDFRPPQSPKQGLRGGAVVLSRHSDGPLVGSVAEQLRGLPCRTVETKTWSRTWYSLGLQAHHARAEPLPLGPRQHRALQPGRQSGRADLPRRPNRNGSGDFRTS
jgi:hypothetical protein